MDRLQELRRRGGPKARAAMMRERQRRGLLVARWDWLTAAVRFCDFLGMQDVPNKLRDGFVMGHWVVQSIPSVEEIYYPMSLLFVNTKGNPIAIKGCLTFRGSLSYHITNDRLLSRWLPLTNEFWRNEGAEETWM